MKKIYLSLFVPAAVIAASCDKTPAQQPVEKDEPTEQPDDPGDQPDLTVEYINGPESWT